ncbi:hypothetical protein K435DRAFT_941286 [Dendrothele bispora CBS 962.96]|uniref:Uncharacterized protein n=1 Tax=Dendrothele bispora (strain CBS 962.96) TaxID=1314807 RepID=A0A4S8M9V7_DENBC|nr:hypothetical protein K435DRAFT_941286 [Dendrothele bispora CBS 962.96]
MDTKNILEQPGLLGEDQSFNPYSETEMSSELNKAASFRSLLLYKRKHLPWVVTLPAIMTGLLNAGLASFFLGWLMSHRVTSHILADDGLFRNALVAVEQKGQLVQNIDGSVTLETRMYGLTLSSIGVQLISLSISFPITLFAAWVSASWWNGLQQNHAEALPTPIQYGLLVKLCGISGFMSVFETSRYISRKSSRAGIPSFFILTFIVICITLTLRYTSSIADTWLHTTASTIIYRSSVPFTSSGLPSMGSVINTTLCPGPAYDLILPTLEQSSNFSNCLHDARASASSPVSKWGSAFEIDQGNLALNNRSTISQVVFVGDIAVLVPKELPSLVDGVHFDTFGIQTQCFPTICEDNTISNHSLSCQSFDPAWNISGTDHSTSLGQYNVTDKRRLLAGYPMGSNINPLGALLTFIWESQRDTIAFPSNISASPGWYQIQSPPDLELFTFYIAECKVNVYDISLVYSTLNGELSFDGLTFTPSDFNTTSALLAGMDSLYPDTFMNFLQTTLQPYLTLPQETFSSVLSGNMSAGLLAVASPLLEQRPALNGSSIIVQSASRYPLAPLGLALAVLYSYAFMAFTLAFISLFLSSPLLPGTSNLTLIELMQARLTNPLANMGDHFTGAGYQPLTTSALDLFPSESPLSRRLRFGLVRTDEGMKFEMDNAGTVNDEKWD